MNMCCIAEHTKATASPTTTAGFMLIASPAGGIEQRSAASTSLRSGRALVAAMTLILFSGCDQPAESTYQGYVEGEFVMVAASSAGRLEKRWVQRGDKVEANAPLFALEGENEKAGRREAEERVRTAEARLANLTTGKRAPELDVVKAQAKEAAAARDLSTQQLRQQERLFRDGFIAQAKLDEARASYDRDVAKLAESEAQIRSANLAVGRDKEIVAARTDIEAARSVLAQSDWRLAQRALTAPVAALVQDHFFAEGEWVPAGSPVLSLLPPGNVKLRFFVPETIVGALKTGQQVTGTCDGCAASFGASISFISRQPEYTPPNLFSRENRAKLVFLVEARPAPADAARLNPGQPVDVTLK
jgi:HlyD family secretion protein